MKTIETKVLFIALLLSIAVPCLPSEGELFSPIGPMFTYRTGAEGRVRPRLIEDDLHKAIRIGDADGVKKVLVAGTDVENRDQCNYTPLIKASFYGQLEMARLLLEYDAGVNEQNRDGDTPLKLAAKGGFSELVKLLLAKGANVNLAAKNGEVALSSAADKGHLEIIKLLLATNKVDINMPGYLGCTALGNAAGFGRLEIAELLLKYGADVDQEDKNGYTPLMKVADKVRYCSIIDPTLEEKQIYTEMIYLLLDFEADLRVGLRDGKTLLKQVGSEVIEKYIHSRKLMQEETTEILVKEVASELSLAFPRDLAKLITKLTYRNLSELTEMLTGL